MHRTLVRALLAGALCTLTTVASADQLTWSPAIDPVRSAALHARLTGVGSEVSPSATMRIVNSGDNLAFRETVKNQGSIEGSRPEQMQVLIVIEDAFSGNPEAIISASIFGMGYNDVLSKQVERLINTMPR